MEGENIQDFLQKNEVQTYGVSMKCHNCGYRDWYKFKVGESADEGKCDYCGCKTLNRTMMF